jgi:hypothetical protein
MHNYVAYSYIHMKSDWNVRKEDKTVFKLHKISWNVMKLIGFLKKYLIYSQMHSFLIIPRRFQAKYLMKFCLNCQKICLYPGRPQNPMLITVSKYIEHYRGKIGTSKKYAYKRNMLITGMLVTGMQLCPSRSTGREKKIRAEKKNAVLC